MLYLLTHPERLGGNFWQEALPALPADRQKKVLSFRFERDRNLSAAAGLLLRLALYTEYDLTCLPECFFGPQGKPYLRNHAAFFSLSHCRQAVACALDTREIGVDIEPWDAFSPHTLDAGLMNTIFSGEEQQAIRTAANPAQTACALWTAKESVCKYSGEGLGNDMPSILRKPGLRIDTCTRNAQELSLSVCRAAEPAPRLLSCLEISPARLHLFLHLLR